MSPLEVRLTQSPLGGSYTGTFTITAEGGPVSYSISLSDSERSYLKLSPLAGTLKPGQEQEITASLTPDPDGARPPFSNPVTVGPGAITVTLEYPPSG